MSTSTRMYVQLLLAHVNIPSSLFSYFAYFNFNAKKLNKYFYFIFIFVVKIHKRKSVCGCTYCLLI